MAGQERNDSGAKVIVACKLPAGLIIRGYTESEESEAVLGGGTRVNKVFRPNGIEHELFGTAVPQGKAPKCLMIEGYAITPNVSKDLWENWFAANREGHLVKKGLIKAFDRAEMAPGWAKEHEKAETGFEPIDPENPGKKIGRRDIVKADVK